MDKKREFIMLFDVSDDKNPIPIECVAELIRCKDCRFWSELSFECGDGNIQQPTDYCSRAKRRDDGKKVCN